MQPKIIGVNPYFPEKAFIREAIALLNEGKLVAFPTETVYGVGADFFNKEAIGILRKIKNRPDDKSFTAAIGNLGILDKLGITLPEEIKTLADRYWPGPLTLIVFNKDKKKIGIRIPNNKIALDLLNEINKPIALPSANFSGAKEPCSVLEIDRMFLGSIEMVLDGGRVELGISSTVLDTTVRPFKVLRKGAISEDDIFSDFRVLFVCTGNSCRSVMAEYLMKKLVKESGLSGKIFVESAGTLPCSGAKAALNTVEILKEENIDASGHKGMALSGALLKKSDFIFVMEKMHRNLVLTRLPGDTPKVRLLKEDDNIPDPIGKSLEEYRRVKNLIKDQVENIFLELFKKEQ
ncbi:MAG: L-threonylcarbamoyladenylate synthase [Candidatus Omnitrophota bacterium]